MAAPHVAGVAALIKQKNPALGPSEIASALTTTATTTDGHGSPLLAQRPSLDLASPLGPATPFDFGGGEVDPTAAMDPGLVFPAGKYIYIYQSHRHFELSPLDAFPMFSSLSSLALPLRISTNRCV
jgi:hypothetical protein